ncbi:hypothetical protein KSP39_PZI022570 [Platanthera zijinensis]|uniref:Uncharacterized protein n=1 Tax=Platanthera zijinensis TaxID=2320716 RepID=A0AAP0AW19_9ASPA
MSEHRFSLHVLRTLSVLLQRLSSITPSEFSSHGHNHGTLQINGRTIEFFIVHSQNIPELPDDETPWSIQSVCEVDEPQIPVLPTDLENGISNCPHRKPGTSSQWPPVDWKSAPDFKYSQNKNMQRRPLTQSPYDSLLADSSNVAGENVITRIEDPVSAEITGTGLLKKF